MISPSVITSKAALNDFNKIKMAHTDLMQSISGQRAKMVSYQQQKSADMQAQETVKMQAAKENQIATTQAQKDAITFGQKQQELDIKRASLSQI